MAYIIEPADGATVIESRTRRVRPERHRRGTGGHRSRRCGPSSLADRHRDAAELDLPIPNDVQHMHFGGGQTEVELTLAPGRHTLQLLLGDHLHIPHDPPIVSSVVTIEVQ